MSALSRRGFFQCWLVGLFSGILGRGHGKAAPPHDAGTKTTAPAGDVTIRDGGSGEGLFSYESSLPPKVTFAHQSCGTFKVTSPSP